MSGGGGLDLLLLIVGGSHPQRLQITHWLTNSGDFWNSTNLEIVETWDSMYLIFLINMETHSINMH